MAWYRAGTVTVANGNASIVGAGTDFVSNVNTGDAFLGPDGRVYEVVQVVSATQLTLGNTYMGGSAGAQGYAVSPTQSFARDLALGAAQLLNTFAAVRDGIGAGLVSTGSAATPGLRFAVDQDTGLYTEVANTMSVSTGGARAASFSASGIGCDTGLGLYWVGNGAERLVPSDGQAGWVWQTDGVIAVRSSAGVAKMTIGAAGSVITTPAGLAIVRSESANDLRIAGFGFGLGTVCAFYSQAGAAPNYSSTAMWIGTSPTTGRSINAGGTLNASGADYAEYMTKADGCGTIAPGAVCGVDAAGRLTDRWADALAYVVKSTDPAYVGGDNWAAHLPSRPVDPGEEPAAPIAPAPLSADPTQADQRAWQAATSAYAVAVAAYQQALAKWRADSAAFPAALAAWEHELEVARWTVDRIAFSGQVPVIVAGDFAPGDYLVPAQDGTGIKAVAVHEPAITFDQYRRRLGRVWAVRDGRAWLDVQHG